MSVPTEAVIEVVHGPAEHAVDWDEEALTWGAESLSLAREAFDIASESWPER